MVVRKLLTWPDPRLKQEAQPVEKINNNIEKIWLDLTDTMEALSCVGLACNQLGIMRRLVVVDASTSRGQFVLMANPEILQVSKEMNEHVEASPNLPGVSAAIKRPKKVTVKYLGKDGIIVRSDFEGLWATSVQHQIDHLNGIMYFDRLSALKRDMLIRKAKKIK